MMDFHEEEYVYLEKHDIYLEWEFHPDQSYDETLEQTVELDNYLFNVEERFMPEIEYFHGRKIIKSLGYGSNGIALVSKGNYVIKLSRDKSESEFALTLAKEFKEWPSIFVKAHKIMVNEDYSILWKDYAIDIDEAVDYRLLRYLYQGIWRNPDSIMYQKLREELQEKQTTKLKKLEQKFAIDFIELAKSHNLKSSDLNTSNIGLSSRKDRLVIFDYGLFSIDSEYKITKKDMNRIIDLRRF